MHPATAPTVVRAGPSLPAGRRTPHWQRVSVAVWTVLVVMAVGRAALYHHPRHQGCYQVFAEAGRHWLKAEDLYDANDPDGHTAFRYSPLVAAGLAPLAWVSDPLGSALLRAVNLLLFLPALWWWARACLPQSLSAEQRAVFFVLCAALGCNSLMDVQTNVFTLACMLVAVTAVARDRWTLAAGMASLACFLKAYPVALALVLALVYPRRFLGRWLLAMLVGLALPLALQRPSYVLQQYQDWLQWGLHRRQLETSDMPFQDLMFLCRRWLAPLTRQTYLVLELVSGAAIALVCLLHRRRALPRPALLNVIFGLCCAWMMVLGPATEVTTYVLLAPAVAAATLLAWVVPQRLGYRVAVTTACTLLVLSQVQLAFPLNKPLTRLAAQPAAALLFLAAAGVHGLGDLRLGRPRDGARRGWPLPMAEGRAA